MAEQQVQASDNPETFYIDTVPDFAADGDNDAGRGHADDEPLWKVEETHAAYIHHSSGTSGSLPKPLPISHLLAVGVLPFPLGRTETAAIFSTTPLYHGGVADCFRAWTAGCMIWLYPNISAITATNVLKSVAATSDAVEKLNAPSVRYFSCVPQVLNFMADSPEGMPFLQEMKMVGVGGAPMPEGLATRLVEEGVKLVSRYGSAECGFLMSSDREYETDRAWQFLRQDPKWPLRFETQDSGLSELVVLPTWPGLQHHNRPDGAFATADLFEPHPTTPRAWRFHSRADAQLTLSIGKKFDPTPLEDAIRESPLLDDIMIFGNDRPFPGALLFRSPSAEGLDERALLDQLWPLIEAKNERSPPHARLSKSMLAVMPRDSPGLDKTVKGTTLRSKATKTFEANIEQAYQNEYSGGDTAGNDTGSNSYEDGEIKDILRAIIQPFLEAEAELQEDADFFNLGVDSSACIRIRARVQQQLIPHDKPQLPLNVVYDCGDLAQLSEFIISFRRGTSQTTREPEHELRLMRDLVSQYSNFGEKSPQNGASQRPKPQDEGQSAASKEVVLLTGVTGTLGAQILTQLRSLPSPPSVHCLVRASSAFAARERVVQALQQRHLPSLDKDDKTVHFHPGKLYQPSFGIDETIYSHLIKDVTLIIHAAWAVNFTMRLSSFTKEHVAGMSNLLNFALDCSAPPRIVFCSSAASALGSATANIPERLSDDPSMASPMGYARSKWVAEQICARAHTTTALRNRIKLLRIGQLCGDTQRGVWNVTEAWPLMLSSYQVTRCLPDLGDEPLNWLPVDTAARAILEIAAAESSWSSDPDLAPSTTTPDAASPTTSPIQVYNILNQSTATTWSDLITWIQKTSPEITAVPPSKWLSTLSEQQSQGHNHPSMKLMDMWRRNYGDGSPGRDHDNGDLGTAQKQKPAPVFDMANARHEAPSMRDVTPIGEEQVGRMWRWLREELGK